jgi:hypothetical protein
MFAINIYKQTQASTAIITMRVVLIFLIAVLPAANSEAQTVNKVQNNFIAYQDNNLQEKIYVHVNKSFYVTGEILWFKVYCVDAATNKPLDISKVVYVDILDNNHTAIMQAKISLKEGKGKGSLFIPVSVATGHYMLRAYTNWMKNFSADYFFEKQITFVNPMKQPPVEVKHDPVAVDVKFFPEGGHLVNGLTGKVAFKVTGTDRKGKACTGVVIDQQNDTVARFKTQKFGIGTFEFTPVAHKIYKAVINTNNQVINKELPTVVESGYEMHTVPNSNGWDVYIKNSDSGTTSGIFLLVHSMHVVKLALSATLTNGKTHLSITRDKLDDGLSYLTLFDAGKKPLCERLLFKRPNKKLIIDKKIDGQIYGTRKKVNLTIITNNRDLQPLQANLSVSVFRADTLQNEDAAHIASYLLLCAELKGHIESPDYYLENTDKEADEALDNLMLSQGWTQFDWAKPISGKTPGFKYLPEYTGHIITGQVVNTKTHEPAKDIIAYLSVPGTHPQLFTSKSDSTGRLLFNTTDFYGSSEIITQTNTQIDSIYHIDISSPFSEQYSAVSMPPLTLTADMENVIADNSFTMQTQNIFGGSRLKQFYLPQTDSLPYYGIPVKAYLLDNYTRFTTMEEVLREYVTSILVSKRQDKFNIRMFNGDKPLNDKPLISLDGVPIFDADKIFHIDPLKVRKLDVVSTDYLYGPVIFNGIMSFTTYKGDLAGLEIDPRAVVLDYEGLQLERKFYSPVYESDRELNSTIPDFRSALYWNPEVITNSEGKNSLEFYTGDRPGKYICVIEGSTTNGESGSRYFTFEVKK